MSHNRVAIPAFVLLSLLLPCGSMAATSPATARSTDGRVDDRIAELERRVLELQKLATVNEVELARLRDRVVELETELRAEREARESRRWGPEGLIDEQPVRVDPPGRVEVADLEPPPIEAEDLVEERSSELEPSTPSAPSVVELLPEERGGATVSTEPVPPAPSAAGEGKAVPTVGQELYDQGYTLYHQGQLVEAEATFQRFLSTYGDTELADNALYWIGESRYSRNDYRGALAAFRETAERYPKGNKVPDALLKAGASLEKLGDFSGARQSYRDIQRRFPDSATALVAAERIARLP